MGRDGAPRRPPARAFQSPAGRPRIPLAENWEAPAGTAQRDCPYRPLRTTRRCGRAQDRCAGTTDRCVRPPNRCAKTTGHCASAMNRCGGTTGRCGRQLGGCGRATGRTPGATGRFGAFLVISLYELESKRLAGASKPPDFIREYHLRNFFVKKS